MTQARARKKTDFTAPIEDGLLTKEAFDSALADRGIELTAHRVRTWRTRGLLPHAQRGGLARYSEDSVAQAIEASRLFAVRNKEDYVGWQLWWGGYDVAEIYWRPVIESRNPFTGLTASSGARMAAKLCKPKGPSLTGVIWRLHAAAEDTGRTAGADTPKALAKLLDRDADERARVLDEGLDPGEAAANMLKAIAGTPRPDVSSLNFKAARVGELLAARDDVRTVFEAVCALHDAAALLAPARAQRLKPVKWLNDRASRAVKADLAVRWMAAVDHYGPLLNRHDLVQMRADAFATLSRAQDFKRSMERKPVLATNVTRRRLADAVRREDALEALCGRIRRDVAS